MPPMAVPMLPFPMMLTVVMSFLPAPFDAITCCDNHHCTRIQLLRQPMR